MELVLSNVSQVIRKDAISMDKRLLYILIMTTVLLESCMQANTEVQPMETELANGLLQTQAERTSIIEPGQAVLATKEVPVPTPTMILEPLVLDALSIYVNAGTFTLPECVSEPPFSQIYSIDFPNQELSLSVESEIGHVMFPSVSNSGEWIAYILSIPTQITSGTSRENGSDSVWIVNKDASNQEKITEDFESLDLNTPGGGCDRNYRFDIEPYWSPNDTYIYVRYWEKFVHKNLIIDVGTHNIIDLKINTNRKPIWVNDDQILVVGETSVNLFDLSDFNNIEEKTIMWPTSADIAKIDIALIPIKVIDREVIFAFTEESTGRVLSLWKLMVDTEEWSRIIDFREQSFSNFIVGEHWATACLDQTGDAYSIFEINSWEIVGEIIVDENASFDCRTTSIMKLTRGEYGEDVAFIGLSSGEFFVGRLHPGRITMESLFTMQDFLPSELDSLISFSLLDS